jgi:Carboxypeptidase regulatory-like domain
MRSHLVVGLCVVLAAVCLTTPVLAQRSDRGVISGIVTEATGSAIAGANVVVHNEGTGVDTTLTTNGSGAYTTPPLTLGTYSVTVNHPGFKKSVSTGIQLQGAENIRQDVTLSVGAVTESVEVKAEAELNVTTPDISHVVDEKYYQDIPTITAADVRLAEAVLQIQPGYLPMKPNGDPMFRGSQFNSRINGGQSMATENFFDGAAFGYAVGHQQSQESAPPIESIQEVKVITTSYAAQYGHTSGGFIEYTSKPGTNTLHGSAYEFFANDALNARGFFDADCNAGVCTPRKKTPLKNNSFGFTLGGPVVIPHVYDGHNKTFFFTNFDWTRLRSGVLPGFGNTTPIDAFKAGDFSSLLTGAQATAIDPCTKNSIPAVDGNGAPIMVGQIYNPTITGTVTNTYNCPGKTITANVPIRTPYAGNIIPAGDPLLSTVASRVAALMVHPDRAGLNNNVAGNPAGDQTWLLNARTIEFRVDHSFSPTFRMSESFYWGHRPSIRNCGEVAGCSTQFNGETEPQKNTSYYGNGFYQRIATHHTHTQFDWIIRPNLLNHTTIAWDRWFMGGNPLSAGAGWPAILWEGTAGAGNSLGNGGLLDQTAGPPLLDFAGNIPYNSLGQYGWGKFGFLTNNRWQFSDDLSWVKGKHTIKVGFEYRWHQFPFSGWANGNQGGEFRFDRRETGTYDQTGNNVASTGESFASFLLGQVDSSTQNIPFHPMFYEAYTSPWINDEYKATSRLTLTLGLRFDYQFARTETQDRYSTFDPNTPNPGAGDLPGALLFAGKGAGRTGQRTFEHPAHDAWGPRFGFAYRVNDKTAIRGGYGIYYSGISFDQFIGQPTIGYVSNPTVSNIHDGKQAAFFLDNGFPEHDPACADLNCVNRPPFIVPSFANNQSVIAVAKNGLTLPRYQNWSLTFERQLKDNLRLDVSYIANRGSRLTADWQKMGVGANMNPSSVLSIPHDALTTTCSSADLLPSGTCAGGVPLPYPTFNGTVAQALRKYPQYQNVLWRDVPLGSSKYSALEVVLEQRYSHGLGFRVGYTYSKLYNDGSETGQGGDGANGAVQDPSCPHVCEWGLSRDDTPHVFLVGFTWEVPFGKGLSSRAGRLALGGWNLAGALRYESGRPMNITMDNPLGGLLFNGQRRPNRVKGVSAVKRGSSFNPLTDNYFNPAAWADPGVDPTSLNPLLGNAPRRDGSVRAFPTYNEDINIFKVFPIKERLNLRFEGQFGNIFNRTDFCDPNGFYGPSSFGTVNTQCNQPRSIQFGLRLNY